MHKTEKTAKESRMNFMYSHLCDTTLAELPDREAFWMLFNESVSPLTSYRIESHTLQLQPNLFKA
jgi:hypothetical protein